MNPFSLQFCIIFCSFSLLTFKNILSLIYLRSFFLSLQRFLDFYSKQYFVSFNKRSLPLLSFNYIILSLSLISSFLYLSFFLPFTSTVADLLSHCFNRNLLYLCFFSYKCSFSAFYIHSHCFKKAAWDMHCFLLHKESNYCR